MANESVLHSGELYDPGDAEIAAMQQACLEKLYDYNQTRPSEGAKRQALLKEMLAACGANCYVEPPFHSNFGGHHVRFGDAVYANFNLTLVDDTFITIGSHTMIGPNVTIATAGHPLWPALRERGLQYNAPVTIGDNCWLGAGVIVLPGITIGANTVVGAGSIVTKDLPANVVAVGDPCRVLRPIGPHDQAVYFKNRPVPPALRESEA